MHPLLNIAISAIRQGGQLSTRYLDRLSTISHTGTPEFIQKVIADIGQSVSEVITEKYPDHNILIRPDKQPESTDNITWIINPLSGSHNFARDLAPFALSIAVLDKGQPLTAAIYNPLHQELFTTTKGGGAKLNNHKMRVGSQAPWNNALIATQTPRHNNQHLPTFLNIYTALTATPVRIRQSACPALDLAHVACDRLDAAWFVSLPYYDTVASSLMIHEAGGIITTLQGDTLHKTAQAGVMAGSIKIHKNLGTVIQSTNTCSQTE